MQPLEDYFEQQRQRVEVSLDQCLPTPDSYPSLLMEAMRYSVFAGETSPAYSHAGCRRSRRR